MADEPETSAVGTPTGEGVDTPTSFRRRRRRLDAAPAHEIVSPEATPDVGPSGAAGRASFLERWTPSLLSSWGLSPTFRVFIFLGSIVGVMSFLLYGEYLIREFRDQEKNRAELYAHLYALAPSLKSAQQELIVDKVLINPDIDFPIIVTNHRGEVVMSKGPGLPDGVSSPEALASLGPVVEAMDAVNPPIRTFPQSEAYGLLYYDGSNVVVFDIRDTPVVWAGPHMPARADTGASERWSQNALGELVAGVEPLEFTIDAQLESVLHHGEDSFVITDASGVPVIWGGIGMPSGDDRSPAALAVLNEAMQQISNLSGPQSFRIRTEQFIHYADSDLIERISLAPLVTIGVLLLFGLVGYVGLRNIRRSEQRSIWVGMAKETAHQLGTPLSSLAGWLELMEADPQVSAKSSQAVSAMRGDMRRLTQIASRFSQIGSVPELKAGDVRQVLTETVNYFRARGSQFGRYVFETQFADVPDVLMSAELMGWTLENLFKNAIDAMHGKDGGVVGVIAVRVSPSPDGRDVQIVIEDNGRGIEPENVGRVFEPGFSTKKRGWGLGLAFVKRIVEEYHRGRIHIIRTDKGEGTTFEILLPAA